MLKRSTYPDYLVLYALCYNYKMSVDLICHNATFHLSIPQGTMCADSTLFECDLHVKLACVGEKYFMPLEEVHSFAFQELNQYAEV